ncbi:hypothetical protein BaRGS_00008822 [Batillaria attramentaria]|uniref:Uncharacterized protein n=1 Tax=Batillaria attramentaria TaxID=370345 RepID=A0ABD0LLT2_9CAEN
MEGEKTSSGGELCSRARNGSKVTRQTAVQIAGCLCADRREELLKNRATCRVLDTVNEDRMYHLTPRNHHKMEPSLGIKELLHQLIGTRELGRGKLVWFGDPHPGVLKCLMLRILLLLLIWRDLIWWHHQWDDMAFLEEILAWPELEKMKAETQLASVRRRDPKCSSGEWCSVQFEVVCDRTGDPHMCSMNLPEFFL